MSSGLYIGRFQPFHLGHLSAIKQALEHVDHLTIGIGSSQYHHTPENPFTAEERLKMIELALQEAQISHRCELFLIPDIHDESRWVEHVKKIVPAFDLVFVGNQGLVKDLFKKAGDKVVTIRKEVNISATEIRNNLVSEKKWHDSLPAATASYLETIDAEGRLRQHHA